VVFRKCDLWDFKQSKWYFTVVELKLVINFLESNVGAGFPHLGSGLFLRAVLCDVQVSEN
jgi:hypothetical protein